MPTVRPEAPLPQMSFVFTRGELVRPTSVKGRYRLDPRRLSALLEITEPCTGADLQQFVCAANWMRSAIPTFNKLIDPLSSLLEEVYSRAGKRTRKAVSRISLSSTSWGAAHRACFNDVKEALHHAATLAHPDEGKLLCMFTYASDKHWAAVLTQIPPEDKDLPCTDQRHQPLSFPSGSFRKSAASWSTPEKEGYAIVAAATRLDYMLLQLSGFWLFTDHKTLTFIFNPVAVNPNMAKHVASKIERWSMKLAAFRYHIVRITGEENVWADLLSRWGATAFSRPHPKISSLLLAPVAPSLDPDFKWPSHRELLRLQTETLNIPTDLEADISPVQKMDKVCELTAHLRCGFRRELPTCSFESVSLDIAAVVATAELTQYLKTFTVIFIGRI